MRLPSSLIPQADVIDDVVRVAEAVKNGFKTYQEIAEYIDKVERQGRYYRLAAEILGLITNERNYAKLTPFGKKFVKSTLQDKNEMLCQAILKSRLIQRVIPFIENQREGVTKKQLEEFMAKVTEPVGPTMMERRASTIISWLTHVGILNTIGDKYMFVPDLTDKIEMIEFIDVAEPLLPRSNELEEYQDVQKRITRAEKEVRYLTDQVKFERATTAHRNITNLVASRIREANCLPRSNSLIDLATRVDNQDYIFEMKSITTNNAHNQIRRGISQLYEYRYLQNLPTAKLVLFIEIKLLKTLEWVQDYLESDRQICLLWDGNNQIYASTKTKEEMAFLWK